MAFKNSSELIAAVSDADFGRVRQLLAAGAEPRSRDRSAWSALHIAACHGSDDIVAALLEAGADIDSVAPTTEVIDRSTYEGSATPLMMALRNDRADTVLLLVERGASLTHADAFSGEDALFIAAQKGMRAVVERLLRDGKPAGRSGFAAQPAVTAALSGGHDEVASILLAKGYRADADTLSVACRRGLVSLLAVLVAAGADLGDAKARQAAVSAAASAGQIAVLDWLATACGDVSAQTSAAMVGAGGRGQLDALRWLLSHGADIDAATDYGWTALTSAAWAGHVDCVSLLLERGANDRLEDVQGKTVLDWAKEGKRDAVVAVLMAKGSATGGASGGRS